MHHCCCCMKLHLHLCLFFCRYGDMRVIMTYQLFSMWQNLGETLPNERSGWSGGVKGDVLNHGCPPLQGRIRSISSPA